MVTTCPTITASIRATARSAIHHLHRRLIALRRERKALLFGRYGAVRADADLLVFTRELGSERILVALNLGGAPATARAGSGDRKSTRLNSSHTVISYAVFCLKKKKDKK